MRVNFRDLTLWSFLMASAHGAGLMLVPVLLRQAWFNLDWLWSGALIVAAVVVLVL